MSSTPRNLATNSKNSAGVRNEGGDSDSGTIPMLVYYGIELINPDYIYLIAFVVPIIFSLLTGTSWGSVGTIGVVIIGIAAIANVDLGITAGAIIGGAYFGDKMSPLSDTTNLAAAATEV